MRTCQLATLLERCGQNLASAPPFRGWNEGGVQTWRHQGTIPDTAWGQQRERREMTWGMNTEQAAGNTSTTITDTTVRVIRRVTEPSCGRETARPIWQWTPVSPMAIFEWIPSAQKFSPWTERLFPVTIEISKAVSLNTRTKNVRLLYQWFRGHTIM
jgi:hypothetical protein